MSCCGNNRANLSSPPPAHAPAARLLGASATTAPAEFEYRGGSVLTVIGQATGTRYRFVGHGARLRVDPRDRSSLAALPHLRDVTAPR
jgi:hypothetical protein